MHIRKRNINKTSNDETTTLIEKKEIQSQQYSNKSIASNEYKNGYRKLWIQSLCDAY